MKKQVPNSNRKILALETSARAVSAAVSDGGKILASGYQDTGLTHSRTLMPIVEHILKNSDLCMGDMDAVAVAVGPGSFTGIRIGVASALARKSPVSPSPRSPQWRAASPFWTA